MATTPGGFFIMNLPKTFASEFIVSEPSSPIKAGCDVPRTPLAKTIKYNPHLKTMLSNNYDPMGHEQQLAAYELETALDLCLGREDELQRELVALCLKRA